MHYHVGQNIPGYLPDSDVDYAATKGEAIELLKERKERWLDAGWDVGLPFNQYVFVGNARTDLGYSVEDRLGGPLHLGYVIWADACHEDCSEEGWEG